VAEGGRKGIAHIQGLRGYFKAECNLHHPPYLLFWGAPVSGESALYVRGRVREHRHLRECRRKTDNPPGVPHHNRNPGALILGVHLFKGDYIRRVFRKYLLQPKEKGGEPLREGKLGGHPHHPGIGEKKARQIVATLQGKAGKFALLQDEDVTDEPGAKEDIAAEAAEVLLQLGYKRAEAMNMIKHAMEMSSPKPKTSEEMIQRIYDMKLMK
jgi:hypothetical protein